MAIVRTLTALSLGVWLAACDPSPEDATAPASPPTDLPPTARLDLIATLREDAALGRHAADGGGQVQLVDGEERIVAGTPGRWTFRYTAGPLGIAAGGMLFFQPPPFWSWSPPQTDESEWAGFTTATTSAAGITLTARAVADGLLAISVQGRALAGDEQIEVVYGASPAGALADRYAERGSAFWFAVDGDGDGVRGLVPDPPRITIEAGPAVRLVAHWPSVARPRERVPLTIAALDAAGNAGTFLGHAVHLEVPRGITAPTEVRLGDEGRATVTVDVGTPGVHRLRLYTADGLEATTNPLDASVHAPRILWGDLHGHSNYSDGTGLPDDYYRYARDIAGLDVAALSDHDHWGVEFLDTHPGLWTDLAEATRRFHDPGRFVTLLAFEWTSWAWGHRHVLYFTDTGPLLSSLAPITDHPEELWGALAGTSALTVAHHPAGGPIPIDWTIVPDPRFEPVVEVSSVHGSSEAADSPQRIYNAVPGHYARDALDRGYQLGFIGSGDTHDGHPGLGHLASGTGGLAAILSEDRTRAGVLAALRARRTYATNGPRIVLRFSVDTTPMGGTLPASPATAAHAVVVRVVATAPLERLDLVRSGQVVVSAEGDNRLDATWTVELPHLEAGEYVYTRVVQRDGGLAWSSPVFSSTNTRTSRSSDRR